MARSDCSRGLRADPESGDAEGDKECANHWKSRATRFLKERDDPDNEKDNAGHHRNEGQSWKSGEHGMIFCELIVS